MARGRKKIRVDKGEFQRVVEQLESQRTFTNPSELWQAVADTDWAKQQQPRPLTAAVAYLRAREFGIVTKTQPGKRGLTRERLAGIPRKRRPRAEKMAVYGTTFAQMRSEYPKVFLPIIDRAEKGSFRAAITLKCLECSGFVRAEARQCTVTNCSLYPHRPGAKDLEQIPETEACPTCSVAHEETVAA